MKVVQETLGLSSITIAADTYTSVLPQLARQSAEDVAALIRPVPPKREAGPAGAARAPGTGPMPPPAGRRPRGPACSRPPTVLEYLTRWDSPRSGRAPGSTAAPGRPSSGSSASPARTGLICLAPASVCQYKITFSPGAPHAVTIAAVKAALTAPGHSGRS